MTSEVGDETGWFFSFFCAVNCGHSIVAPDIAIAFGTVPDTGSAYAYGFGLNGPVPFGEGYLQISRSPRYPIGFGARFGLMGNARQGQFYGRANWQVGRATVMWNPGFFIHSYTSPNPGRVTALVNGFGVLFGDGPLAWTPSVAIVASRAQKGGRAQPHGVWLQPPAEKLVFAQVGMSVTFRSAPEP